MRCIAFFSLALGGLLAQDYRPGSFSYGFKLGSPINDPQSQVNYRTTYQQGRWTGGPTIELHLPYRFSIEFDALYRQERSNQSYTVRYDQNLPPYVASIVTKTRSWDFPLLLKYRFAIGNLRPFVSGGWQFTHENRENTAISECTGPTQNSCAPAPSAFLPGNFYNQSSVMRGGPAAGAGLEFKTRYVTITPELRFSRAIHTYPRDNRFTGMVGFTFGGRR